MKNILLSIIIVTFNSEKQIINCLDSIIKNTKKNIDTTIIIVDNKSTDNTIKIVKRKIKSKDNITLIKNNINVGFAKAVNQGITSSRKSDYYLLLNPDTEINSNSITGLVKCAEEYHSGICGGNTINIDGIESGSYFRFPNLMVGMFDFTNLRKLCKSDRWHNYFYYKDIKLSNKKSFPVDVVTGGYMLIDKSTIKKIGLLDESYFMYLEDVDYCLKAKKSGINIFHTNESNVIHIGGASSNNKDKIRHSSWLMSRKTYFIKHYNIFVNILIQIIFLFDDFLIISKKLLSK